MIPLFNLHPIISIYISALWIALLAWFIASLHGGFAGAEGDLVLLLRVGHGRTPGIMEFLRVFVSNVGVFLNAGEGIAVDPAGMLQDRAVAVGHQGNPDQLLVVLVQNEIEIIREFVQIDPAHQFGRGRPGVF